jgi:hypothetical protein
MPIKSTPLFSFSSSYFENTGKSDPRVSRISVGYFPSIIGSKNLLNMLG